MFDQKTQKKGWFAGLFSKKKSADQMAAELRKNEIEIDKEMLGLAHEMKTCKRDVEKAKAGGIKASQSGDTAGKREAAMDLKHTRMELAFFEKKRSEYSKARLLARLMRRKLEWMGTERSERVLGGLKAIMSDPSVQDAITNAEVQTEAFTSMLEGRMATELGHLESSLSVDDGDLKEEMDLFDEIAKASQDGDMDRVQELNSRLDGDAVHSEDSDEFRI